MIKPRTPWVDNRGVHKAENEVLDMRRSPLGSGALRAALGIVVVTVVTTGCGFTGQSSAALEKAARKVPVPAGLLFRDVYHNPSGDGTNEVDVSYTNTTLTCPQLRAAWAAALTAAHRTFSPSPVDPEANQIFIHGLGANVAINLGGPLTCANPYVAAQDN